MTQFSKNEDEWKQKLSKEQYEVCRNKATEQPFFGKYYLHDKDGICFFGL